MIHCLKWLLAREACQRVMNDHRTRQGLALQRDHILIQRGDDAVIESFGGDADRAVESETMERPGSRFRWQLSTGSKASTIADVAIHHSNISPVEFGTRHRHLTAAWLSRPDPTIRDTRQGRYLRPPSRPFLVSIRYASSKSHDLQCHLFRSQQDRSAPPPGQAPTQL